MIIIIDDHDHDHSENLWLLEQCQPAVGCQLQPLLFAGFSSDDDDDYLDDYDCDDCDIGPFAGSTSSSSDNDGDVLDDLDLDNCDGNDEVLFAGLTYSSHMTYDRLL